MKCLIIEPDGKRHVAMLNELEDYQKAVGGYVEGFDLDDNANCYINEEGKLDDLPYNELATRICHARKAIFPEDYISGPMVVFGAYNEDGEGTDISDDLLLELMKETC